MSENTQPIPEAFEKWIQDQFSKDALANPEHGVTWIGYLKGGRATYRHLSSQPSPGLRWVKASERLPEQRERVCIRITFPGTPDRLEIASLYGERLQTGMHEYNVVKQGAFLEWLEEAPTPSVQPIEGEQSDWVEATTPPTKEGFYNVVTAENILIIDAYRYGRWDYDMIAGPSDCPDYVARYRTSTYEPLHAEGEAPKPNDIDVADLSQVVDKADGKEVPEEIMQFIGSNIPHRYLPTPQMLDNNDYEPIAALEQDRDALEKMGVAMYWKMQEKIWKAEIDMHSSQAEENRLGEMLTVYLHELKDTRKDLAAARIQIEGLETSNKEWGEKYTAVEKEMLEYIHLLNIINNPITNGVGWLTPALRKKISDTLAKYLSPTPTNKDNG